MRSAKKQLRMLRRTILIMRFIWAELRTRSRKSVTNIEAIESWPFWILLAQVSVKKL